MFAQPPWARRTYGSSPRLGWDTASRR
jgi:hypothetical protein